MINYVDLALRLKGKSVKDDALMPWCYQFANPKGRPYHDDWRINPSWPWWLQPWTRIKRMDTTFLLPMPAKLVWAKGNVQPEWLPFEEHYAGGLAPGAQVRDAAPGTFRNWKGQPFEVKKEILTYHPVLPAGQAALFAVWLDGAWRDCYYTRTEIIFGKRVHTNRGIKFDMTFGDIVWNYPEASFSVRTP